MLTKLEEFRALIQQGYLMTAFNNLKEFHLAQAAGGQRWNQVNTMATELCRAFLAKGMFSRASKVAEYASGVTAVTLAAEIIQAKARLVQQ